MILDVYECKLKTGEIIHFDGFDNLTDMQYVSVNKRDKLSISEVYRVNHPEGMRAGVYVTPLLNSEFKCPKSWHCGSEGLFIPHYVVARCFTRLDDFKDKGDV